MKTLGTIALPSLVVAVVVAIYAAGPCAAKRRVGEIPRSHITGPTTEEYFEAMHRLHGGSSVEESMEVSDDD